jgi:uncharacterized protein involved in cysteine biosynthesis
LRCGYPAAGAARICEACARSGAVGAGPSGGGAAARPAGFAAGAAAFARGVAFLLKTPRTKRYAVIPFLIAIVVFAAGFHWLWGTAEPVRAALAPAETMAAWLRTIILGFLTVVFVAIFALLVWATASSITAAIAAPILDLLVGRVDEVTFGAPRAVSLSWVSDAAFNIGQALLTLCLVLPLNVAAFAVAWIPPIGPFAGLFLVSTAAGFAALDIAAARRRFTLGQKIRVATTNFPAILGFGAASAVVCLIPCVGWMVSIPAAAVGGALLFHGLDLRRAGM